MSDFSVYKALEGSRVGATSEIANAPGPVAQSHTRNDYGRIANLSANLAEDPLCQVKYRANVVSAAITSSKAFVANTTDYTVVLLQKRTGSGAAVTVGTANLANVAGTAFVPIAFAMVAGANATVAAGDQLTMTSTITGNGVANNGVGALSFFFEDT